MPIIPYEAIDRSLQSEPATREDELDARVDMSFGEGFSLAFGENSEIGAVASYLANKFDPSRRATVDPDFDPFDGLEDTPYADYASSFIGVRSREDFERTRRRIDRQIWSREQFDNAGLAANIGGFVGEVAGSPTNLLPGGAAVRSARLGSTVLSGAKSAAVAGLGGSVVSETIMQGVQETRTLEDSLTNVVATTLLSGVLGGSVSALGFGADKIASRTASRASAFQTTLDTYSSGSLGAAQAGGATSLRDEGLKGMFGLDKALSGVTPITRAVTSPSAETRRAMARLTEDALLRNKNADGVPSDISVYRRIEMRRADLATGLVGLEDQFLQYRMGGGGRASGVKASLQDVAGQTGGKLTRSQFAEEVGRALIRGDKSDIAEVQTAAELIRKTVFDPLKEAAIENGLLPEGVSSQVAESYLTRVYNREMIAARRKAYRDGDGNLQDGFEDRIAKWLEGRQARIAEEFKIAQSATRAARAALDEQKALASELGGDAGAKFGPAIEKAEARLARAENYQSELTALSGASPAELQSIATEITDRVLSMEDLGTAYKPVAVKRGPLKELTLTIPTKDIEDFLIMDADRVARVYHRVMSADVELTRRFGRADMEPAFEKIRDDYSLLRRDVEDEAELTKLHKNMERDIRDLSAVRDMIRGTYAMPDNPNGLFYRVARTTKTLNFLRLLGGMTISAIPDTMRPMFVHGPMRFMRDGLLPLMSNWQGVKLAAHEARIAGAALEMALDSRAYKMADVADEFGMGRTGFERGMDYASSKFGLLSLMSPWNDALKKFSGMISQTRTLEVSTAWATGGKVAKKDIERLANLGIDRNMAGRIADQFQKFGEDQAGGLKWANTAEWADTEAAEFYRAALGKETDKIIVTPSPGERPIWMSSQVGQIVSQFQSFTLSSMQRVLMAGLQQRDASALAGFIGMASMGAFTYYLKTMLAYGSEGHSKLSDDPMQWVMEGIDRSGAMGYAFTFDRALDVATRGNISLRSTLGGEELSRWRQREGVNGMLGPTLGTLQDMYSVIGGVASGEPTEADIGAARRLVPGQNLFYWRWLFDEAEAGLSEYLAE